METWSDNCDGLDTRYVAVAEPEYPLALEEVPLASTVYEPAVAFTGDATRNVVELCLPGATAKAVLSNAPVHPAGTDPDKLKFDEEHADESLFNSVTEYATAVPATTALCAGVIETVGLACAQLPLEIAYVADAPAENPLKFAFEADPLML